MKSKIIFSNVKLILGSQSMARKRILADMGYDYTIVVCSFVRVEIVIIVFSSGLQSKLSLAGDYVCGSRLQTSMRKLLGQRSLKIWLWLLLKPRYILII